MIIDVRIYDPFSYIPVYTYIYIHIYVYLKYSPIHILCIYPCQCHHESLYINQSLHHRIYRCHVYIQRLWKVKGVNPFQTYPSSAGTSSSPWICELRRWRNRWVWQRKTTKECATPTQQKSCHTYFILLILLHDIIHLRVSQQTNSSLPFSAAVALAGPRIHVKSSTFRKPCDIAA